MFKLFKMILINIILFNSSLVVASEFLAISDIHFNPYEICEDKKEKKCTELLKELINSKPEIWDTVFEKYYDLKKFPLYGKNTNYSLFKSLLQEVKRQIEKNNYKFVVVLGDFLAHFYVQNYEIYSGEHSKKGAEKFISLTLKYLSFELKKAVGNKIEIFPVIGNNDSYIDNYNVDNPKGSNFYKDLLSSWGELNKGIKESDSFLAGGYYLANTSINKLSIIALNTNIFSLNAKSSDNTNIKNLTTNQLNWFEKSFNKNGNNNFLVISHIPCAIDPFTSIRQWEKEKKVATFWSEKYVNINKNYLNILTHNSNNISGILVGHTHHDGFQLLNQDLGLYSVSVPGVSLAHFNNPAFKVFKLDEANNLSNAITYYFDVKEKSWKQGSDFNQNFESKNLFIGMQSLVGKWLKDLDEPDEKFLKYFFVNSPFANKISAKWKYYACAMSDNLETSDYEDCLNENRDNKEN